MADIEYLDGEYIPDGDLLYYRIHKNWLREGEVMPGVFRETGEGNEKGMSTDWSKYSSPEESRNRARNPSDNGVICYITGNLRDLQLQVVHAPFIVHKPIENMPWFKSNSAHTNVNGIDVAEPKKTEIRLKLKDLFKWEIPV